MQKYKNSSKDDHSEQINGYLLVKININQLKLMSKLDIKAEDYQYIELYETYMNMRGMRMKVSAILQYLADENGISVSTVKRIINRFRQSASVAD